MTDYARTTYPGALSNRQLPSRRAQRAATARPSWPHRNRSPREACHLLALPAPVTLDDLELLALAEFSKVRWAAIPMGHRSVRVAAARTAGSDEAGELTLTRHTRMTGPFAPPAPDSAPPLPANAQVFEVLCPRQRWEPGPVFGGDRDGLVRAFPGGLPRGPEARVVNWLIAVARRLGGSVVFDVGDNSATPVTPVPEHAIELAIYSSTLLDSAEVLAAIQPVLPTAALNQGGADFAGPPAELVNGPPLPGVELTEVEKQQLHAAADEHDLAALQAAPPLEGYAVGAPLAAGGYLSVEASVTAEAPSAIPAQSGCARYRIRWDPPDLAEANAEHPTRGFLEASRQAAGLASRIANQLVAATGGVILDQAGFPLDPASLTEPAR